MYKVVEGEKKKFKKEEELRVEGQIDRVPEYALKNNWTRIEESLIKDIFANV